jgi:hypothetical protein
VRGVALLLGCLVASCAPDYGHSAFRCNGDHGCPDGQRCVIPAGQQTGRCHRGEAPNSDGVVCGAELCDVTQQCCFSGDSLQASCSAAGAACPESSALCDGVEDCQQDDWCCADGDTHACDATCKTYACRDKDDCPPTQSCCGAEATHWGLCSDNGC